MQIPKRLSTSLSLLAAIVTGAAIYVMYFRGSDERCLLYISKQEYKDAFDECSLRAQRGSLVAKVMVGKLYEDGGPVQKDYARAEQYYLEVARSGDKVSALGEFGLGELYLRKDFEKHDDQKAAEWYKRSADKGNKMAQRQYGAMALIGRGVKQDIEVGKAYVAKAATSGDEKAKQILEILKKDDSIK